MLRIDNSYHLPNIAIRRIELQMFQRVHPRPSGFEVNVFPQGSDAFDAFRALNKIAMWGQNDSNQSDHVFRAVWQLCMGICSKVCTTMPRFIRKQQQLVRLLSSNQAVDEPRGMAKMHIP